METKLIIAIIVGVIVVAVVIMRWVQRQKLYKFVDDVAELLTNPSIYRISIRKGDTKVDIEKDEVEDEQYELTGWGDKLHILKEEKNGHTVLIVGLINQRSTIFYRKSIEMDQW